jgi:hypothetical protein
MIFTGRFHASHISKAGGNIHFHSDNFSNVRFIVPALTEHHSSAIDSLYARYD